MKTEWCPRCLQEGIYRKRAVWSSGRVHPYCREHASQARLESYYRRTGRVAPQRGERKISRTPQISVHIDTVNIIIRRLRDKTDE